MLKILLKIWPGLLPFFIYFFWLIIFRIIANRFLSQKVKKEKIIDAEIIDDKKPLISKKDYSLNNNIFFGVVMFSCLLVIFLIIRFGTQYSAFNGEYYPAKIQNDGSVSDGGFN